MAYQRIQFKQIIRQRCDLENTTFETEVELDRLINDCVVELHDLLISCAGSNYSKATGSITTTVGVADYQIAAADFYRPIRISTSFDSFDYPLHRFETEGVISNSSSNSWGPDILPRYSMYLDSASVWHISFNPPPDRITTVNLTYHTTPPVYVNDTDVISIPYAAAYIPLAAALVIKDKEDRDSLTVERKLESVRKKIEDWGATFDRAQPFQTIDVTRFHSFGDREF